MRGPAGSAWTVGVVARAVSQTLDMDRTWIYVKVGPRMSNSIDRPDEVPEANDEVHIQARLTCRTLQPTPSVPPPRVYDGRLRPNRDKEVHDQPTPRCAFLPRLTARRHGKRPQTARVLAAARAPLWQRPAVSVWSLDGLPLLGSRSSARGAHPPALARSQSTRRSRP